MVSVNKSCESLVTLPLPPLTGSGTAVKTIFLDKKGSSIAYRAIQNVGGDVAFVAIGRDASNVDYNFKLSPGQILEINTLETVTFIGATTIAATEMIRPL